MARARGNAVFFFLESDSFVFSFAILSVTTIILLRLRCTSSSSCCIDEESSEAGSRSERHSLVRSRHGDPRSESKCRGSQQVRRTSHEHQCRQGFARRVEDQSWSERHHQDVSPFSASFLRLHSKKMYQTTPVLWSLWS